MTGDRTAGDWSNVLFGCVMIPLIASNEAHGPPLRKQANYAEIAYQNSGKAGKAKTKVFFIFYNFWLWLGTSVVDGHARHVETLRAAFDDGRRAN